MARYLLLITSALFSTYTLFAQQTENFLLGKIYSLSSGMGSVTELSFNNRTTGVMDATTSFNGKELSVNSGFSYSISGNNLTIRYDKTQGTENYYIEQNEDKLVSTNLQGYVDGKWGKVTYKRKYGAGTPGQIEGSNYWWNQVPATPENKIKIGEQTWMTKNLNVNRFQNGDTIAEAKTNEDWKKYLELGVPAWCYYLNDQKYGDIYGKLYNWYAVNDSRGLAPKGWHIPTMEEWNELVIKKLGDDGSPYGKPAYYMKSRVGWAASENSPGEFGNTSGFSAVPGGFRNSNGDFKYEKYWGLYWTLTKDKNLDAWNKLFTYDNSKVLLVNDIGQKAGLSVRCIADYEGGIKEIKPTKEQSAAKIIGQPIRLNYLEIAQFDFPKDMSWYEAKKACAELGSGWRLPTRSEMNIIYQNKNRIGNFNNYNYWTATENSPGFVWRHAFNNGEQYSTKEYLELSVRAVKTF